MSSDLTFITNEAGQSLQNRFEVLLGQNTRLFDCLVGYFFITGFHRLHPALASTEKIRILVGIKTDGQTVELIQSAKVQQEFILESHAHVRERVPGEILSEFQKSGDSAEIEEGIRKFVEWIKSGKLEVRAFPSERVHAKVYIMTFVDGHIDKGRVVTGSSNFTEAGLRDNLEFNVELKNRSDYEFALAKFNELWAKSVDVTKDYVTTIEVKSPFAQFTPYELYLKFLYEYFRGELNLPDEIEDIYLPDGFKKLKYQEEAVLNARKVLDEYGGTFLSDVVGLGKTYMSALLAQHLNEPCLVIAPPHLLVHVAFESKAVDSSVIQTKSSLWRNQKRPGEKLPKTAITQFSKSAWPVKCRSQLSEAKLVTQRPISTRSNHTKRKSPNKCAHEYINASEH